MNSDWRDVLLGPNSTIRDVINTLNRTGLKIALIVDESNELVGVITDGDIRRSVLQGNQLELCACEVMNKTPVTTQEINFNSDVVELMKTSNVFQLPIVNEFREVIGLHLIESILDVQSSIENEFVIMAGGFGKRLLPYTLECPKPMLKIMGRPILQHIIELARGEGFQNFTICVYHLSDVIKDYFGNGSNFGISIEYIEESKPLGTAGALGLISLKQSLPAIVTNGDVLSNINYRDILNFHNNNNADLTIAVRFHEYENPFGVIETNGINFLDVKEKPIHRYLINAGVYVLNPDLLEQIRMESELSMTDFIREMKKINKKICTFLLHEEWIDVGREDDFLKAKEYLQRTENEN